MYPVVVGVIELESNKNWVWFMERLKEAIGTPVGLTFSTDCGQPLINSVSEVFPQAEHRECMYHLVQNSRRDTMERFLMRICGNLHILGALTCLRNIINQWLHTN